MSPFISDRRAGVGTGGCVRSPAGNPMHSVSGPMDMYGRPASLSKTRWDEEYLMSTKDLCSYRDLESIVQRSRRELKNRGADEVPPLCLHRGICLPEGD